MTGDGERLSAFVLMPFGGAFDDVFEQLIRPPLEAAGFDVSRADSTLNQRNILQDVVEGISRADLIVADLSELNPNVFYELGIAHALAKPTVMITVSLDEIPFDLRGYRTFEYSTNFRDAPKLVAHLEELVAAFQSDSIGFGNPVTDYQGIRATSRRDQAGPRQPGRPSASDTVDGSAGDSDDAPRGLLDYRVEMESAMRDINRLTEELSDLTSDIGDRVAGFGPRMADFDRDAPGAAAQARAMLREVSSDMRDYAKEVRGRLPAYQSAWDGLLENGLETIRLTQVSDAEDTASLREFHGAVSGLMLAITGASAGMSSFKGAIDGVPPLSQDINRAKREMSAAIGSVIDSFATGLAYTDRIAKLVEQKLSEGPGVEEGN